MQKKFKVGDRVRVITKEYDTKYSKQHHDVGVVSEATADSLLPVRVVFEQPAHAVTNSYQHEDLEAYPVKAEKPRSKTKKAPKGAQAYKGNGKHEWEEVVGTKTWRLRVPGGWLYRDFAAYSLTFVPVPEVVGYAV